MGEAKRRRIYGSAEFGPKLQGKAGALAFLEAFHKAPPDADIEMRIGHDEADVAFAVCSVGAFKCAMGSHECRVLADAAESALRTFPKEPEARSLPNLIMALREIADRTDAANKPP